MEPSTNYIMSDDFVRVLNAQVIPCQLCIIGRCSMRLNGRGSAARFKLVCNNCPVEYVDENPTHPDHQTTYMCDLKATYACLINDIGHDAFSAVMHAQSILRQSDDTMATNKYHVYEEMEKWYQSLKATRFQKVIDFYHRNGIYETGGKHNICVSIDGSYPKRSYLNVYNSIYCVSFIFNSNTGTCIDYCVVEKCLDPKCNYDTTLKCKNKLFHGSSKTMEVSAAITLFDRTIKDPKFPFRYTILVCDGDSNVFNHIQKKNYYGDKYPVTKEECMHHYRKRCRKTLAGVFK